MTRFFELIDDVEVPGRWHVGEVRQADGTVPRLRAGVPYANGELIGEIFRAGEALPFSLSVFAVPIVRTNVAEAIERVSPRDVQRLPVRIEDHEGFEALNVVRVVKCLDETRSKYMKWTSDDHRADLAGQYRMVTNLRVDRSSIPSDAHVFRVESWLIALIVSEHVKTAMEAVGCRGARFADVT